MVNVAMGTVYKDTDFLSDVVGFVEEQWAEAPLDLTTSTETEGSEATSADTAFANSADAELALELALLQDISIKIGGNFDIIKDGEEEEPKKKCKLFWFWPFSVDEDEKTDGVVQVAPDILVSRVSEDQPNLFTSDKQQNVVAFADVGTSHKVELVNVSMPYANATYDLGGCKTGVWAPAVVCGVVSLLWM